MDKISTRLNEAFVNFKTTDLETMIADLEKQLKSVLDEIAPERTKFILVRPTNPWFTEEVKTQKRLMRNRNDNGGNINCSLTGLPSRQSATSTEQCYGQQGNSTLSDKVNECEQDTKKLYDFVNSIIGRSSENLMPKSDSDELLAEECADYFIAKIRKICNSLENHPIYKPVHLDIDLLKEFQLLTEQEV